MRDKADIEFVEAAGERLTRLGFSLVEEHQGGREEMWRYDNGVVSIALIWELMADTSLFVTMAGSGGGTHFLSHVWADFLGVPKPGSRSGIDAHATPVEGVSTLSSSR
ncbi:hypothetical protein [Paractinoplanes durhamensis]|uniref:Uncharacterized protein n=1 Tax=Paractinoplanes durhamensis TaxID=113563 RepID=A0ABQ3ZAG3_9ACTN|nr:hypothetical protein [Actinoplanes durhamensis]GIE06792.1 hypothetical protein Adu01nite_81420 [Actinoplanes durhamensis]